MTLPSLGSSWGSLWKDLKKRFWRQDCYKRINQKMIFGRGGKGKGEQVMSTSKGLILGPTRAMGGYGLLVEC